MPLDHTAVQNVKTHNIKCCFESAGLLTESSCSDPPTEDSTKQLDELLHKAVDQLHLEKPLILEVYTRVDQDAPATEELGQGWEHELL